jgi:hypothetical protein
MGEEKYQVKPKEDIAVFQYSIMGLHPGNRLFVFIFHPVDLFFQHTHIFQQTKIYGINDHAN